MALKLTQQQKLRQGLSPGQIQTIKLIELPVQSLEQRIEKEMEENPALEEDENARKEQEGEEPRQISLSDYKEDDSIPAYRLWVNNQGRDEKPRETPFSVQESFAQSLLDQLGCRNLSDHEVAVASFIICSLDSDGYLRRDTSSLVDDMAFRASLETDETEVERMIAVIQELEPSGVGARDLRECLLLQLRGAVPGTDSWNARTILSDHFEDFSAKHYQKIMQRTGMGSDTLKAAIARIVKLNPSPGGQVDDTYSAQTQQVIPDFVLRNNDGSLELTLPRFNIPELRVSRRYKQMLEDAANPNADRAHKEAAIFAKQKIDSAKWFINALEQRHNTLQRTMQAIIDYQKEYFLSGDDSDLKPMVLKDIAAATGLDISTISRVANSKYIDTEFGILPLKYFFSEGLENAEGEQVSTRGIKTALRSLIDAEDKSQPLTDDQIVQALTSQGYKLARRTVAKYRDLLGIPTARMRKELV